MSRLHVCPSCGGLIGASSHRRYCGTECRRIAAEKREMHRQADEPTQRRILLECRALQSAWTYKEQREHLAYVPQRTPPILANIVTTKYVNQIEGR